MEQRLTFIKFTGYRQVPSGNRRKMGLFKCSCGKQVEVCISMVNRNHTRSCGCIGREKLRVIAKKIGKENSAYRHGLFGTKFHKTYFSMVNRTKGDRRFYENVRNEFQSFDHFLDTMYQSYCEHVKTHGERQTTLDRIDTTGNYSPTNCRWATYLEQGMNRKNNHYLTINRQTKTLGQWRRDTGLSAFLLKKQNGLVGVDFTKIVQGPKFKRKPKKEVSYETNQKDAKAYKAPLDKQIQFGEQPSV